MILNKLLNTNKEIIISIVDINWKKLIEKIINNVDEKFEFKMNLNYLKSGLYLMKIELRRS